MKVDRPTGTKIDEPQGVGIEDAPKPTGQSFAEMLAGEAVDAPGAVFIPSHVKSLVERLKAGELTIDKLLEDLAEHAAKGAPLGEKGLQELRSMLRSVLESDPVLLGLARAVEQG